MKKFKLTLIALAIVFASLDTSAQKVETLVFKTSMNFEAINWLPDGRIFVADYGNGRLYKLSINGFVETLVTEFANIAGGGVDQNGNFYFSGISNGTVNRLNDGGFTQVASGFNQPVGILPSETSAEIFLAVYGENAVYQVNVSDGSKTKIAQGQGINGPDGMVFDDEGNLIVANFNTQRIHKIDKDFNVSLFADLPVVGFAGYIAKNDEHYFIPSIAGHKIFQITKDGEVSELAGSGEEGNADGDFSTASFSNPNGIALNPAGDTMLVSDGSRIRMITGFKSTTSSLERPEEPSITLSPNPCGDLLTIDIEAEGQVQKLEIFNASGLSVLSDTTSITTSHQVDVKDLSAGIYSMVIHVEEGKKTKVLKFVKI